MIAFVSATVGPAIGAVRNPAIDANSHTDPAAAIETLQTGHGISRLDIVIANAGICEKLLTRA
ncbi:hypothetical protein PENVUL_c068G01662 [Penicillium vulpinum]|uniref:Uncharacterized protein n=1 Tax=Penicillium vulpinum TaxID=29845 RepID=A0A1V6RCB1_9EURO|nr:hypothetical protein PENVUL_c068G01662 [Penicillium vulpinum]